MGNSPSSSHSSASPAVLSARDAIDQVRSLLGRAATVLNSPEVLRASVRYQLESLTGEDLTAELRRRPVDDLRSLIDGRVRLASLGQHGYRSVADIYNADEDQLTLLPGIGLQTARKVIDAARIFAARIRPTITVRIDPQGRTPGHTYLLTLLAAFRSADSAFATLRAPITAFRDQAEPLIEQAKPVAVGKFRLLFTGAEKKRSATIALEQVRSLLVNPRTESIRYAIAGAEQGIDPSRYDADQLWRDYIADAASINSLLASLSGASETEDTEAAHGYIEPELQQKIAAIPLDTSQLRATLRRYQVFGAQYAIHQERSIIGDEMGLGKTVQALAVMAHMAAKGQRRFMVVCPASVQVNWLKEIEKHTHLVAHSLHGRDRDEAAQAWLRRGGVAVTTYSTLGNLAIFEKADVALLVVDEAHFVKNPDTLRSRNVQYASSKSQRILFLTGTPMENRVEEFRNLVGYLQPSLGASISASDTLAGAKHFRRAVAPVYLRRNQEDVLTELPEKIEVEDWVQLNAEDEDAYRSAVVERNVMRMRRAAFESPNPAKLERLKEIVDEAFEDGRKVIVFSYFLDVLNTTRRALTIPTQGPLTGSVSPRERQRMIDAFTNHTGPAVLLSQIEAGGVGLNVQAASIIVITEPQWKPSTEEQAVARAHRMGQTSKVQVHRLLAKNSVDERIRELLEHKQLLFNEFARKSDAKNADPRAVDGSYERPDRLDDEAEPRAQRVLLAEQLRLGLP